MEDIKIVESKEMLYARQASKNSVAIGILLTVLGIFAIMSPVFTGIAVTSLVGVLLVAAGIVEIIFAFKSDSFGKGALKFIFGGLSILAGILIFTTPEESMAFLTLVLIVYFMASGAMGIFLSFKLKPEEGWVWMLLSGVISILFGIFVIMNWPAAGVWIIGLYIGLRILMHGFLFITLGRTSQDELTHLQDSRIEMLEKHAVEGARMINELQVTLVEQAAMLAVLNKELKTKVSSSDVDPSLKELNKDLGEARDWMKDVKSTTMKSWDKLQKDSREVLEKLKKKADVVTKDLKNSLGLDKG
jgi:uncharacterized membrane protein HdeD (DUF308 family)